MTDRDALEEIRATLALYREGRLSLDEAIEDLQLILEAAMRRSGRPAPGDLTAEPRSWAPRRSA